ncbi:MAG TPA: glycosyltransferase family 4 protein [Cytophagaceae bacterium]|nr:glycosyltransferase family 4 protein [Cytophagaceae bacterium]
MRVAIVVNSSWNIYNFRLGIVKDLLSKGIEVIAIAPEDQYSKLLLESGCKYQPVEIENKGSNPFKDLLLIFHFYKIYKKYNPDIILHFTIKPNIYGTLGAHMAGIPVINNVSGLGTVFLHKNITSYIAKKLYKLAFRFPVKVFFQNKDDLQLFVQQKLLLRTKTELLPGSGVNTQKFSPAVTLKQNSEFTFLMVARLLYDKGIVEYAEATRILKKKMLNVRFKIVGAIDETANLGVGMGVVKEWEAEGILEYHAFTDDLIPYYHQADCVVLPSYREGTPRSLLEAGSCGIPMIATNVPGCKEVVIDNINGFLCKVKDAKDLATKMEQILTLTKEEYLRMSYMARKHILENFDENIVIRRYLTAINNALS